MSEQASMTAGGDLAAELATLPTLSPAALRERWRALKGEPIPKVRPGILRPQEADRSMKPVRCAIYTRKSSEDGLEQDFNSLDAQREACAAYVLSQASEGWTLLPGSYDDGGISGGTLERPGLQRLLADVAAGQIDIIVIYKLDRLTRSLLDFARLVEQLDQAGTSFISVTQSFNTTTSMGRLTLNMLLSFAQFEREVTTERIRDKVAASKAKGMWMGRVPPLGYRPDGRTLAMIEEQAALLRAIFARYRRTGNARLVAEQLARDGITTPLRTATTGTVSGGGPFSRGYVCAILKNPIYTGRIAHRGTLYPGLHPAIISQAEWDEVQALLTGHRLGVPHADGNGGRALLSGRLVDAHGEPLIATHTRHRGRRYHYYVSKALHEGSAAGPASGVRIPAAELEQVLASELAQLLADPLELARRIQLDLQPHTLRLLLTRCQQLSGQLTAQGLAAVPGLLAEVQVHTNGLALTLSAPALSALLDLPLRADAPAHLIHPTTVRLTRTGRAMRLVLPNGCSARPALPNPALLALILRARHWWAILRQGQMTPIELARVEGLSVSYLIRVVRLAFLAPKVVAAALEGRLKAEVDGGMLLRAGAIPVCWQEQEAQFVAAAP